jgi:uncharacterized protein (TIGR02217 family)
MTTLVFPTLRGLGYSLTRASIWKTRTQPSISGKETRLADWSSPRYRWDMTFNFLQQGAFGGQQLSEMATLLGFYDQMCGGFNTFLFQDSDDYQVTSQVIGTTDGINTGFQAQRTFGGATMPVLAINAVTALSVGGQAVNGPFTFNPWGYSGTAGGPGYIFLPSVYPAGEQIVASFSYYFPCRFDADQCEFEKFASNFYALKKLSIMSVK